jgi:predicted nucleic acid-binding protein
VRDCATLIINPIVSSEVSIGFSTIEALGEALPFASYERDPLPWEVGFLAGKCYLSYRRLGGQRPTALPDSYIGAHVAIERLALLMRDVALYRTYFPKLEILGPV